MSEIKQINTGVAELLAVKVDAEDYDFSLNHDSSGILSQNDESEAPFPHVYWLPKGKWQILGLSTELTEEQCKKVMPAQVRLLPRLTDDFKELVRTEPVPAKETFASLMQANGCYSVNPYRNPDATNVLGASPSGSDYEVLDELRDQWKEAEANTGTWLLLKRLS